MISKTVSVYVCIEPGCPSYYGSDSMGDLRSEFAGPKVEDRAKLAADTGSPYRKSRAQCPINASHGERVLVTAVMQVPTVAPEALPLPAA